ncbi:MAG: serine/threonine-protein kinase [Phycisphaerales bacterium]
MSTARWEQVKSLFHAAMELPAPERGAFLETQCKGDSALRQEVESLLAARTQEIVRTGGAAQALGLGDTAGNTRSTMTHLAPITETAGTVIGPYKLLQVIGEGGFGTVFLAEQHQPVRRRVALKIIKLGMDTKSVVARFEAERQALALMEHPHIARVLDGGATDTGRPYFVMEYVVGDSITKFADAHSLTVNERLDLFQQVCSAVQHAHTKGIIHRDLKPGNVLVSMVDGKPFAKVIDFGIAKATAGVGGALTDKTLFTEHKLLIGTPEYMSPEQAEGSMDIDTRTDVYSLGVLLYELLTGTTPIDSTKLRSAAYDEMRRMIREDDPPMPSMKLSRSLDKLAATAAARKIEPGKLSTIVKGELDWIVMKALEKERGRRYETANALGDDVRRHLLGEAVVAAPMSRAYRLRKFVRRNRGPVAAISAVMLALVAGGSVAVWQANEARKANSRLEAQVERANIGVGRMMSIITAGAVEGSIESKGLNGQPSSVDPLDRAIEMGVQVAESLKSERDKLSRQQSIVRESLASISNEGKTIDNDVDARMSGYVDGAQLSEYISSLPEEDREIVTLSRSAEYAIKLGKERTEAAEWSAYSANIALAQAAIDAGDYAEARNRVAEAPISKSGWERRLVELAARSVVWSRNVPSLQCVALSPDGQELAVASYGAVSTYRVTDGAELRTIKIAATDGPPSLADLSYSSDGKLLLAARVSGGSAYLLDALSGKLVHEFSGLPGSCWSASISHDSRFVATSASKQIDIWDASSGQHIRRCDVPTTQKCALTIRYAADGTRLLMELNDGRVRAMNCTSCKETPIDSREEAVVLGVAANRRWSVGPNSA